MSSGEGIIEIAMQHIGEQYELGVHYIAPKNRSDYRGPWDCAEFVSWCIYQASGLLYGCRDNDADPASADASTQYWARDAAEGNLIKISVEAAARIPGAVVLRAPVVGENPMGHIALSDGHGGTVEAVSPQLGVARLALSSLRWDTGILVPSIAYRPHE
jgi:N-acetylmuramoyl-L-alanine amidase